MCINCCLTVEPRYFGYFFHQNRLQTFANDTGSGFQDSKKNFLNPGAQDSRFRVSGFKKFFLNLETVLNLSPRILEVLNLEYWILNLES